MQDPRNMWLFAYGASMRENRVIGDAIIFSQQNIAKDIM
jgi:hypothetical protein